MQTMVAGGFRPLRPQGMIYEKKQDGDAFIIPWATLPMLGLVRFHWRHEKIVPPQHS